jgi:L-2-hydroxyglutarate oxidase LhgO
MEEASVDCVVIGAGVVGLAIARSMAMAGREVLILEAADAIGTGTSSRNSEVIHAGIYYPKDSLKARLCVSGRELLYDYCQERGVAHRRVGKLIVAAHDGEIPLLADIKKKAEANGVTDLDWLSAEEAKALEPELACVAALLSPSTGIIDSHALMLSLLADAESQGATLALLSPVIGGEVRSDGIMLEVGGTEPMRLLAKTVINSAGLGAQGVSKVIEGIPPDSVPPLYFCKGNYFLLSGKTPFSRLVYPVPGTAGLGTHFTLDLGGQGRFGPDTEWIEAINYQVEERRGDSFYAAIRQYWPGIKDGALRPGYAGIRPKIQAPSETQRDFLINQPLPGWIALYGIESPGLTSCLAIAEMVKGMAE